MNVDNGKYMKLGDLGWIFSTRFLYYLDATDHLDDIYMDQLRALVRRSGIAERYRVPACVPLLPPHPSVKVKFNHPVLSKVTAVKTTMFL
jgi:hypothetical protein